MTCKSKTYNKPAIPKGTRSKFCISRLFRADIQAITSHYLFVMLGFCTFIYALTSVYFGTFG